MRTWEEITNKKKTITNYLSGGNIIPSTDKLLRGKSSSELLVVNEVLKWVLKTDEKEGTR